ncbi:hypothetical protein [Sorangium sp. So ce1182]|uniref:hypothetical protein n=1 Tax=Sorangium sp. So ce1182 TaxID=3133334 RepID=UPI003F5E46A3
MTAALGTPSPAGGALPSPLDFVVEALAEAGALAEPSRPAACDDRIHLLCEACAPNAQGRIACPACAKRR